MRMAPLALLSAEGKRSSKYFPDSASMASSRAAVMRKRYNRLFYGVLGIKHGSHRLRVPEYYPHTDGATHAPQTDAKPSGRTALKRVKRAMTVLKPSRRL